VTAIFRPPVAAPRHLNAPSRQDVREASGGEKQPESLCQPATTARAILQLTPVTLISRVPGAPPQLFALTPTGASPPFSGTVEAGADPWPDDDPSVEVVGDVAAPPVVPSEDEPQAERAQATARQAIASRVVRALATVIGRPI
jgi:hypothetical protein